MSLDDKLRANSAPSVILNSTNCRHASHGMNVQFEVEPADNSYIQQHLYRSPQPQPTSGAGEGGGHDLSSSLYSRLRSLSIFPASVSSNLNVSWRNGGGSSTNNNHNVNLTRRASMLQQSREKLELQICRINVLLVMMQIGLGLSMFGLGLYLKVKSNSMTFKDCPYWAALPLFSTGLVGLFFCLSDEKVYNAEFKFTVMRNMCGYLSIISAILCAIASIFTGHHGNWLAYYSVRCPSEVHDTDELLSSSSKSQKHYHPLTPCCRTNHTIHTSISMEICECGYFQEVNSTNSHHRVKSPVSMVTETPTHVREWFLLSAYNNLSCYYVFSGLKDYLILQCALYCVAVLVCTWLSISVWCTRVRDRSRDIVVCRKNYYRHHPHPQHHLDPENNDPL